MTIPGSATPLPETQPGSDPVEPDGFAPPPIDADAWIEARRAERGEKSQSRARTNGNPSPQLETPVERADDATVETVEEPAAPAAAAAAGAGAAEEVEDAGADDDANLTEEERDIRDAAAIDSSEQVRRGKSPQHRINIEVRKTKEEKERADAAEAKAAQLQRDLDALKAGGTTGAGAAAAADSGASGRATADQPAAAAAPAPVEVTKDAIAARVAQLGKDDPEPSQDAIGAENGFATYEDWHRAHNKWSGREAVREDKAQQQLEKEARDAAETQRRTAEAGDAEAQHRAARLTAFQTELATAKTTRYKDFDTVVAHPEAVITGWMQSALLDMDNAVDVAYALGKDPAESKRIAGLPSFAQQASAIARLSAKLAVPSQQTAGSTGSASGAATVHRPAVQPVSPAGSRASGTAAPLDQVKDPDEYVSRRRRDMAAEAAANRRGGARRGR